MVKYDDESIINIKFLLYYFEWMSGLKINYHKSEVLVFGVSKEGQDRTANMLNYQVGTLPMTYHKTVGVKGFERILEKMRNKLQPWKGKNLSSGGRLILTNSSLSSIPTYRMFSLF